MTEKIITMNIPTIGDVEFCSDADFRAFLVYLEGLRTLDELRAVAEVDNPLGTLYEKGSRAAYNVAFWGDDDCE